MSPKAGAPLSLPGKTPAWPSPAWVHEGVPGTGCGPMGSAVSTLRLGPSPSAPASCVPRDSQILPRGCLLQEAHPGVPQRRDDPDGPFARRLSVRGGHTPTYRCGELAAPVPLRPGVTAQELQRLELQLQIRAAGGWRLWLCWAVRQPPTLAARQDKAKLTVAEPPRGPRALASLPSVTKPEAGGLPAALMGLSATFLQST